ncbi:MAG: TetR/AcrR family transcriptional regulator [Alphaproteobacteria bacterium]
MTASTERSEKPRRHSREDWLETALAVLIDSGIEDVQITRLATRMEVTRGSFYWHFTDRTDLVDALIDAWRNHNTGVMVDALESAETLTEGILRLFSVWVDHGQFNPKLDQAMRDWARRSEEVHTIIVEEDDRRIETIAQFFRRFGYQDPEAFIRARVIYFTQVSYYALEIREPMDRRMSFLTAYFRCFTGQEMDEAAAQDYRKRMAEEWS